MVPGAGRRMRRKEAFHVIYRHSTKVDARRRREWETSLDKSVDWAFRERKVALRSWWMEIFNYYDRPSRMDTLNQ